MSFLERPRISIMLIASLATFSAVPIWFIGCIAFHAAQGADPNTVAIQAYAGITFVLALPASLIGGFIAGPTLSWVSKRRFTRAAVVAAFTLFALASLPFVGQSVFLLIPKSVGWLLLPYNVASFVGPSIALGCCVFLVIHRPRIG